MGPVATRAFRAQEVAEGLFQIWDSEEVSCFLILGSESALLMDSGYGLGDLRGFVSTLTPLPVQLVNSHGHVDHVGGNYQFDSAYLHPADFDLAQRHTSLPERKKVLSLHGLEDAVYLHRGIGILRPLLAGHRFQLGDRTIEAVGCPGHTRGGMALLDHQTKILLGGDSFSRHVWLFDEDSTGVEELITSIRRVQRLEPSALLCSHSPEVFPPSFFEELARCAQNIAVTESTTYHVPIADREALVYCEGGELFQSPDFVSIVYLPAKLSSQPPS